MKFKFGDIVKPSDKVIKHMLNERRSSFCPSIFSEHQTYDEYIKEYIKFEKEQEEYKSYLENCYGMITESKTEFSVAWFKSSSIRGGHSPYMAWWKPENLIFIERFEGLSKYI